MQVSKKQAREILQNVWIKGENSISDDEIKLLLLHLTPTIKKIDTVYQWLDCVLDKTGRKTAGLSDEKSKYYKYIYSSGEELVASCRSRAHIADIKMEKGYYELVDGVLKRVEDYCNDEYTRYSGFNNMFNDWDYSDDYTTELAISDDSSCIKINFDDETYGIDHKEFQQSTAGQVCSFAYGSYIMSFRNSFGRSYIMLDRSLLEKFRLNEFKYPKFREIK